MPLKSRGAWSLIVKKCRFVQGVCFIPLLVIAWHKRKEVRNTSWSVIPVDDFCCFTLCSFSKDQSRLPIYPFISPQWEKSSLSQLVCLLKYKGCLFFKRACGPANIHWDNSSYLCNRKLSTSLTAECKMEACLSMTLANQQREHLIYRGGGHKSIMADAHIINSISMCPITVSLQLQSAQKNNTVSTGIVSRLTNMNK